MDLRKFLMDLRNEGILKFVDEELSINYEIPYVITRFDKGPALEFTNVREFKEVHVVGNVVNTRDKVYRALNVRSDIEFYRKLLWAEDVTPSYKPSETNNAVYEPLPNVDLTRMPIPRYFELEPGPA